MTPPIEICTQVLMEVYKRNQVEEAISRVLEPRADKPSLDILTRLKRLLDTDRGLGRQARSTDPERNAYAFYGSDAPGSGVEVWFSSYDAFALLNGIRLMNHGWPQGFAVQIMRKVKRDLEREHARILSQDPKSLFDQEAIRAAAQPGDFVVDNTDPVFLTIVSRSVRGGGEIGETIDCAVRRGPADAMKFLREASRNGGAGTMFELAGLAHRLAWALSKTTPRPRGRAS